MRIASCAICVAGLCLALALVPSSRSAPSPLSAKIARGEYLVNRTSMCSDCHTMHDAHGAPVEGKYLQGSKLDFKPAVPLPPSIWADTAPSIAGLVFLNDEQAVTFFTTGKMPDGKVARAPMPQYRFSKGDAEAMTAYLKSLATTK